jgi:RHS repeat-associated protein
VAVTDESGNRVEGKRYLPYGLMRGAEDIDGTGYQFTDQERDGSTGLYNYDARLYDPVIGLFLSADTIVPRPYEPQNYNRFSYVLNNPLRYVDPTGHFNDQDNDSVKDGTGSDTTADNASDPNYTGDSSDGNYEHEDDMVQRDRVMRGMQNRYYYHKETKVIRGHYFIYEEYFTRRGVRWTSHPLTEGRSLPSITGVFGATDFSGTVDPATEAFFKAVASDFLYNTANYSGIFMTGCYAAKQYVPGLVYQGINVGSSALHSFINSTTPVKDSVKIGMQAMNPTPPPGNLVTDEVINKVVDTVVGDY